MPGFTMHYELSLRAPGFLDCQTNKHYKDELDKTCGMD